MSWLFHTNCDRRRGGRCRGAARKRIASDAQLGLFPAGPGPCPKNSNACGEETEVPPPAEARCRELMCAKLVIPLDDPFHLHDRLAGISAVVEEGAHGEALAIVPQRGLLRLYENAPRRRGRLVKEERLRSERALDRALAGLERHSWIWLQRESARAARR